METAVYWWMFALSLAVLYVLLRERDLRRVVADSMGRVAAGLKVLAEHLDNRPRDDADDWKNGTPHEDDT